VHRSLDRQNETPKKDRITASKEENRKRGTRTAFEAEKRAVPAADTRR